MKILSVGAELFRADGRKDMTNLIVDFRSFVNAPQNCHIIVVPDVVRVMLGIWLNCRYTVWYSTILLHQFSTLL
jgi:hypothetical protein